MDDYVEQLVPTVVERNSVLKYLGAMAVTFIGVLIVLFFGFSLGVLVTAVGAFLVYLTAPELHLEYEYEFTDGDCRIAKIINKSSRKRGYKFKEEEVKRVLPYTSEKFKNEIVSNPDLKVRIFTSKDGKKKDSWYSFILQRNEKTVAIIVELNAKSLDHVKKFYKNKFEA